MESQRRTPSDSEHDDHDWLCGFAWRALVDPVDSQYYYADNNRCWPAAMALHWAIRPTDLNSPGHHAQCLPQGLPGQRNAPKPRYRPVFFCELVWLVLVSCASG